MSGGPIGVLGGSFNPPHVAHVMLALLGLNVGGLSRVMVFPTFAHAFDKPLAPFAHRLRMCELAFADLRHVEVSALEEELGGTSRTLRLVSTLQKREPSAEWRLLVGSDILAERDRWQDFDAVCAAAPLMVASRVGHPHPEAELGAVLPEVSSSALRAALARGEHTPFIPRRVRAYIAEHGLYRGTE